MALITNLLPSSHLSLQCGCNSREHYECLSIDERTKVGASDVDNLFSLI